MALLALLLAASMVAGAALALRRRHARPSSLSSALDPMPAGVKALANTVSDLSDLGVHLHAARGAGHKPRLGALLDLRHS